MTFPCGTKENVTKNTHAQEGISAPRSTKENVTKFHRIHVCFNEGSFTHTYILHGVRMGMNMVHEYGPVIPLLNDSAQRAQCPPLFLHRHVGQPTGMILEAVAAVLRTSS